MKALDVYEDGSAEIYLLTDCKRYSPSGRNSGQQTPISAVDSDKKDRQNSGYVQTSEKERVVIVSNLSLKSN